jgi:hypothetical protein
VPPFADTGLIRELATRIDVLLNGQVYPVHNATVYSNIATLNPPFAHHVMTDIYIDRTCQVEPVALWRFDADAILFGGDEFLVQTRGLLVSEQIAPYLDEARIRALVLAWRPVIRIREETLLVARYGLYTWGHWLGELLPKIVVAEARYPGRFRFALPSTVTDDGDPLLPVDRMRESLLAYGIGRDRFLLLYPAMNYLFDRLHAVTPVWSDHVMHPGAAALMRDRLHERPNGSGDGQAICLERTGPGRTIENMAEIRARLEDRGFTFHTVSALRFIDQVRLFQSASTIFAILGSDLSGLIYAPKGASLITAAPSVFGDRFFYAMLLERRGRYADLRGPVTRLDPGAEHRSSFHLDASEIGSALTALEYAS